MSDLIQQLESYGEQLEELVPPTRFEPQDEKQSGPPWQALLGIAASIVLIVGALFWVLQSDDETQTLEVIDQVPTEPTETVAVDPTVVPTPADISVQSSVFEPELTLEAPADWQSDCAESSRLLEIGPETDSGVRVQLVRVEGESTREVFESIAGAAETTLPFPDLVGEAPALTFDATAPEAGGAVWIDPDGQCSIDWADGEQWRFWIVDVDTETVVMALSTPEDSFRTAARQVGSLVDTIVWSDFDPETSQRNGAVLVPAIGVPLVTGEYFAEQFGTSLSFTVAEQMAIQRNAVGYLVATAPDSVNIGDRDIVIHRVTELLDPANVDVPTIGMDPARFDDWLESPPSELEVGPVEVQEVGGYQARVFDLRFRDNAACMNGQAFCWPLVKNESIHWIGDIMEDVSYRVYWIDQGSEDPIMILVGAPGDSPEWFDFAQDFIDTVEFGEIRPNLHTIDS